MIIIFQEYLMNSFAIVTDSFCELTKEVRKEYDIDFIPGHMTFASDGREAFFNLEWDCISREDFYSTIKKDPNAFTSSPPSIEEIAVKFEEYASKNIPIFSITLSSKMSGTYNFFLQAKGKILEKYPEAKIEIIDSLKPGPAYGIMLVEAAEMRAQGKSFEEVSEYMKSHVNHFHQCGTIDDLRFVALKGRITNSKAFFGQLVGIKPFAELSRAGMPSVIGNTKGEKKSLKIWIDYMKATGGDFTNKTILMGDSMRGDLLAVFKKMIEDELHPRKIVMTEMFAGCGLNVGPGLMSAYYEGIEISEDMSAERQILQECILKNK